jgi:hypothetical protein
MIRATVGDSVRTGDAILELSYRDPSRLAAALARLDGAVLVGPDPPPARPLIIEEVV